MAMQGGTMIGATGGVAIAITREHRGAEGWRLVASLSYPSLGLGLAITRSGFVDAFRRKPLKIGHAAWDADHRIGARFAAQAAPLVRALAAPLTSFFVPHMDDDDARLEIGDQGDERALELFVRAVSTLCLALDAARFQRWSTRISAGTAPAVANSCSVVHSGRVVVSMTSPIATW